MSARTKVDLDAIAEKCLTLQLTHVAECLPELVEEAVRQDLAPVRLRIPAKWKGQSGGSGRVVSEQVARVGAKRRWR